VVREVPSRRSRTLSRADRFRGDLVLRYATIFYVAGWLMHNGDHWRRGLEGLTPQVQAVGAAMTVASLIAVTLILVRHRLASLVAMLAGFFVALGVAAVHLAPRWSVFSDAFPGGRVDAWSWIAVLVELVSAVAFGAAGAYTLG
jgi:hypothetical protein